MGRAQVLHSPAPFVTGLTEMPRQRRAEMAVQLRLAAPLMAGQLAHMGMSLTDTIMVGRYSPDALAAVAVGSGLWNPLMLFSLGVLLALSTSVAHLVGEDRRRDIAPMARQGLWLALALALPVIVILWNLSPLMVWMAVDPGIVDLSHDYLSALAFGAPGTFCFLALRFYSEGLGHTRPIMAASVLGLLVNIPANYLLIYGGLGLPEMGARGCGIATAIAMWIQALALGWYVHRHPHYRDVRVFRGFSRPQPAILRQLLVLGVPIGMSIFTEASAFGLIALFLGNLGPVVVAGHQIALNVSGTSFMIPLSLGLAATVRVGHAQGAGRFADARFAGLTGIRMAAMFMFCMGVLIAISAPWIAVLYTRDPAVAAQAAHLLLLAALFQVSDGTQVSASGALRGLKDTKVPMLITVLAYWGVAIPMGFLLGRGFGMGVDGFWIGLIAGLSVSASLLTWRFHVLTRRVSAV